MDVTDFLPNGFNLRAGAGGGDPKAGLCFMETVALIAGEPIGDHPECACPILTAYGIRLNDRFSDADRQKLLPLAWATAGTRSDAHRQVRLRILGEAACDMAEMVLPKFEAKYPGDLRPRSAIETARRFWRGEAAIEELRAAKAAAAAADADGDAASAYASAAAAAYAAYASADAYAAYADADAYAAAAAAAAADAAYAAAAADADLREKIIARALRALREAIEAGPNGGIPGELIRERIERVASLLPVAA
jgi:hypothetical protein